MLKRDAKDVALGHCNALRLTVANQYEQEIVKDGPIFYPAIVPTLGRSGRKTTTL